MIQEIKGRPEVAWEEYYRRLGEGNLPISFMDFYFRAQEGLEGRWLTQEQLKQKLEGALEILADQIYDEEPYSDEANRLHIFSQPLIRAVSQRLIDEGYVNVTDA